MNLVKIRIMNPKTGEETKIELNPDRVVWIASEEYQKPNLENLKGPNGEGIVENISVTTIALDVGLNLISTETQKTVSKKLQKGY